MGILEAFEKKCIWTDKIFLKSAYIEKKAVIEALLITAKACKTAENNQWVIVLGVNIKLLKEQNVKMSRNFCTDTQTHQPKPSCVSRNQRVFREDVEMTQPIDPTTSVTQSSVLEINQ